MKHPAIPLIFAVSAVACSHPAPQPETSVESGREDIEMTTSHLNKLQFEVTQEGGTEPAFRNEYWDNKAPGLYVDVVSGEPLFSSTDKFESGTGWPSFTKPVSEGALKSERDFGFGMVRTEVRSKRADSHLGHVFEDGPEPTGLRYCMNSAAMRFVPVADLEAEGYGEYLKLFPETAATATQTAYLAGGCFWGMEDILRELPGVVNTEVGYSGGSFKSPTYGDVKTGESGHAESIRVDFDPARISYGEILATFFRMHDPTTRNRQGNDVGSQYRSAIFFTNEEQREAAELAVKEANDSGRWKRPVVTEIVAFSEFTPAEDYHQDYLEKTPGGYTCHFLRD